MIPALRLLIHIDNRVIPLLEVGHGCLPAGVGIEERWFAGVDEWRIRKLLLSRIMTQRAQYVGGIPRKQKL